MKSKASIKSHPLHPILIAFPIAFFTGSFLFDLLAFLLGKPNLWYVGRYMNMAGIAGALLAAVPGIIDYFNTVPPNSSAKKRAGKHGLINVTNVLLFAFVLYYRGTTGSNEIVVLVLEFIGMILLSVAGWMGGTLVYRNQIGVDQRYADAGRWKEQTFSDHHGSIEVATSDELKINQMKLLHVGNKRIVLARTETKFVAFDDRCTHKGGSLAAGSMMCGMVQCPWHGSQFNVETGNIKAGPAKENIQTYSLEESNGKVFLKMP